MADAFSVPFILSCFCCFHESERLSVDSLPLPPPPHKHTHTHLLNISKDKESRELDYLDCVSLMLTNICKKIETKDAFKNFSLVLMLKKGSEK